MLPVIPEFLILEATNDDWMGSVSFKGLLGFIVATELALSRLYADSRLAPHVFTVKQSSRSRYIYCIGPEV